VRAAQVDKADKPDSRPERADKADRSDKGEKPDRSEKHDARGEPSIRSETDVPRADKPDRHEGERKAKKHDDAEPRADKPVTKPDVRADGKSEDAKARFTLQLSSFQDKAEAEAFLSTMRSAGFQAYVTEADVGGKGTFYRVRLGSYRSLEAANDAKAEYEKAARKTAQVMRL
jgi:cell division septation protein DedD